MQRWSYPVCVGLPWRSVCTKPTSRAAAGLLESGLQSACGSPPWSRSVSPISAHGLSGRRANTTSGLAPTEQRGARPHRRRLPVSRETSPHGTRRYVLRAVTIVLTFDDVDGTSRCAGPRLFESTSVVTSLALQEPGSPLHVSRGTSRKPAPNVEREATSRVSRETTSAPNTRDWRAELGR